MNRQRKNAQERVRRSVKRGAALLDKYVPGWAEKVNGSIIKGIFEMHSPRRCVLGSLELVDIRNNANPKVQFNGITISNWSDASHYGFNISDENYGGLGYLGYDNPDAYDYLADVWKREVDKRVAA